MPNATTTTPIALGQGEGETRWFLGALTTIKSSGTETAGRSAVTENVAPRGHGSPLHVHHREDEWFFVLSGELTFWVGGEVIAAPAGSFVYGPQGVPHTFTVSSDEARFLLVVEPAGLEDFIRALSDPAPASMLPPADPAPPDPGTLAATAAAFGIEILGPPGIPDENSPQRQMSSGRTGARVSGRPVAARSAETTAAVETTVGGSPTPFTP